VYAFLRGLQDIARRQLAEVRQIVQDYYEESGALEPVSADELLARMRAKDVVVLDVRPVDEYASGHIAGAVSIPLDELERRLSELPRKKEIVAYCRGPYCVFALQATGILRAAGYRARRLREGLPDWREAGHAVAVGAEASARKFRKGTTR
jgi:ArsR family transcriptional regulator